MSEHNKSFKNLGFLLLSLCVVGILKPVDVSAQENLLFGNGLEYYYRVLQVSGTSEETSSFTLRPVKSDGEMINIEHPWRQRINGVTKAKNYLSLRAGKLYFYEPVFFQSYNSTLPRGTNDGALWQGKGYNMAFTSGAIAEFGPLHIHFRPQAGLAQNLFYDLGPYDPPVINVGSEDYRGVASDYAYRDFRGNIDYVQRYGDSTHSWVDWGESSVELRRWGMKVALSNKQVWTGPALHTALQFGYSAPGFRHLYLGTYRPLSSSIGSFEFAYIFGGTRKSDYFDADGEFRNRQSVNSLFLSYSPSFIPGLSAGVLRSFFHPYPNNFSEYHDQASKLYEAFVRTGLGTKGLPDGYKPDNQVATVFLRWIIPGAGLEVYSEYGRNDHNVNLRDFRQQPNHARAYTLGMVKTIKLPENRLLALNMEINQLATPRASLTRGNGHLGGWYTHSQQAFGLTNRGQIMGTGYGPGVNMQIAKADLYSKRGRVAVKAARIQYHNSRVDQFFHIIEDANASDVARWQVRNTELLAGLETTAFLPGGIELSAALEYSFIFNQHNLNGNDMSNLRMELILRKQIEGWLR